MRGQAGGGGAEREGFEPSNEVTPVTRFPVAPVQPLRHLSRRMTPPAAVAPICDRRAVAEGYDTHASAVARLPEMLLAASAAVSKDIGLIATFGGIGLIVNIIVVYIAIQVRGEHRQNQEYREQPREP